MKLQIKEPCHEDWNNMKIGIRSRHCDVCEKSVIDFTQQSRAEIIAYLLENKDQNVCGRMTADQFDFRHEDIPVLVETMERKKTANPFLILALVCLSLSSYAQQETNHIQTPTPVERPMKIGKMVATPPLPEEPVEVEKGEINVIEEPLQGEVMLGNVAVSKPEKATNEERVYKFAEKMPEYPGGVMKMMDFVSANLRKPNASANGNVYVRFVVETDGRLSGIKVVRSGDPAMDAEAIRLVESMPNWVPGENDGEVVPVVMTIPVRFEQR